MSDSGIDTVVELSADYQDDALAREQALRPDQSVIVQAPAGSGKTGLLVYRILRLLAISPQPESVLAITFTRKATREMRERLLGLLQRAEKNAEPKDAYDQQGLDLGKAALEQDKKHGWNLLDTPQRIQIQTIDALSLRLVAAMPWLSRLGAQPAASDDAESLYKAAIEQFLVDELLGEEPDPKVQWLLTELDFNYLRISTLFSAMLAKRDQWLRHLLSGSIQDLKPALENAWDTLTQSHVSQLEDALGSHVTERLADLVAFAYPNIVALDKLPKELEGLAEPALRGNGVQATAVFWCFVTHLLCTNGGTFRKRLDKNVGFPTEEKDRKNEMSGVIAELCEDEALLQQLQDFTKVPLRPFNDYDWEQLEGLEYVLKRMAAYLQLQFRARGKSDHSEVTQRANLALQEFDDPTELSLKLDYQINHILVDEFQDTSFSQIGLLKRLMLGWSSAVDQGSKTLFLVGDPMQSIYRFREADVGLFLDVWNNATTAVFPDLDIMPLSLSRNFRSSGSMVQWFNDTFSQVFPAQDNSLTGAVRYAYASTHRERTDPHCVDYLLAVDQVEEAALILEAVKQSLQADAQGSIAILVRSRGHLEYILPLLDAAQIDYQGLNLAPLSVEPAVIDVLHLTRALSRQEDRIAWLALLRGPWVGLSLSNIQTFCPSSRATVIEQIRSADLSGCPIDVQKRVERFKQITDQALAQRQQTDLNILVRWTWLQLGGQHTQFGLSDASMEIVFARIAGHQNGGELVSLNKLEQTMESLFSIPDISSEKSARVVITTIHKSKGLEFDTVILPGLSKQARSDSKDLLMWAEWQAKGDQHYAQTHLLLAPLSHTQAGPHYEYLRHLENQRGANERSRLLYVATTRAAKKLVLSGSLAADTETDLPKAPAKSSLLAELWPSLEDAFKYSISQSNTDAQEINKPNLLQRLDKDFAVATGVDSEWRSDIPTLVRNLVKDAEEPSEQDQELEFAWAGEVAVIVGNLVHQWFEHLSFEELQSLPEEPEFDFPLIASWRSQLNAAGLDQQQYEYALRRLLKTISQVRDDENARFIFADRPSTKTELGVAAYLDGALRQFSIDRVFEHEGELWIVDHKTTDTRETDVAQFAIQQVEERHRKQLELYGGLMRKIDDRPIQLAVYFPLLKQLRTWPYKS